MIGQFTPNGRALGTIFPYRFVALDIDGSAEGADNGFWQADANAVDVIGVSDGSINNVFDASGSEAHADAGELVRLQPGTIVTVQAGGTISKSAALKSDADGKAVATTTATDQILGLALEDGADGGLIRILFNPSYVTT